MGRKSHLVVSLESRIRPVKPLDTIDLVRIAFRALIRFGETGVELCVHKPDLAMARARDDPDIVRARARTVHIQAHIPEDINLLSG